MRGIPPQRFFEKILEIAHISDRSYILHIVDSRYCISSERWVSVSLPAETWQEIAMFLIAPTRSPLYPDSVGLLERLVTEILEGRNAKDSA